MKTFCFRIISFVLDILLVLGVTLIIGFFNPNKKEIETSFFSIDYVNYQYDNISKDYKKIVKDVAISEEEYNEIKDKFPDYYQLFEVGTLNKDIKKNMLNTRDKLINENKYTIKKDCTFIIIVYMIISVLYFGILANIMNGQTLFMKLFRLKIRNNSNIKQIIRSIILSCIPILILDIVLLYVLNYNSYINFYSYLNYIIYLYYILFVVVLVLRDDSKSIEDIILDTDMVRYDKHFKAIESRIFND